MKNNIYISLLWIFGIFCLYSCNDYWDSGYNHKELLDKSDKTSSERLKENIKSYKTILKDAEHGWLLEYFPHSSQKYGGYSFALKFKNDNSDTVTVWSELYKDGTASESSIYDVIPYGGPVLTFSTYNKIFMGPFATPSSSKYKAKGGDFEFLLMSHNVDTINLQGVKTTNKMRLIKLKEPFSEYVKKTVLKMLNPGCLLTVVKPAKTLYLSFEPNRHLLFKDEKGELLNRSAFITTDKGLRLYKPITIKNIKYQDFILNESESKLTSDNGNIEVAIVTPLVDMYSSRWVLKMNKKGNRSDALFKVFDSVRKKNAKEYKGEVLIDSILMGSKLNGYVTGLEMYSSYNGPKKYYPANYSLDFKSIVGKLNYLNISGGNPEYNKGFYNHFIPFVKKITDNSPYKVDKVTAKKIKLTSDKDPDVWFVVEQ